MSTDASENRSTLDTGDHWYEDTQALESNNAAGCCEKNLKGIWLINLD